VVAAVRVTYIVNLLVKFQSLDRTFAAISDPKRRGILEHLAAGPATVSELARPLGVSLPGVMKHVRVLEDAQLVTTEKRGRIRECRLGPADLEDATRWIELHRRAWERRLDRLERHVARRKGET
jgi:DNA-binding transcriptional ArsR family regulator